MSAVLGLAFLQGLIGSLHCAGMCGPFVHALNAGQRSLSAQLIYNLGRSLSYMSTGMLLGWLGVGADAFLFKGAAAWIGGVLLVYFGLATIWPALQWRIGTPKKLFAPLEWIGRLLSSPAARTENALLMGIVSGLLPCGLLYSAYGLALAQGDPLAAALVMFAFSLGGYPMLLGIGLASGELSRRFQTQTARVVMGVLMIVAGGAMISARMLRFHADHGHDGHSPSEAVEASGIRQ